MINISLVAGRWSLVAGRWSLVAGRWSLVAGRWSLVAGVQLSAYLLLRGLLSKYSLSGLTKHKIMLQTWLSE
ncbi:Uncharacterised protein [Plesiomonas shigelloides]|uniref:hypothetical protein n=1 Tax=Plesiomonas shigelloides TaxID=703 RepID=UPI0007EC7213|nr:hypothetical protein [Plesiomonas shigelloides]SBT60287.1 Uncharacterised protein [Plesiomonas shigelloides]